MATVTKNRKMSSNFNCSYMTMSRLTNILGCSVKFFFQKLKQQWTIEEISILSNSSHLEWRAELSDIILKRDYPRTIPTKFALIWFSGFRGEDLNVIFYHIFWVFL
jgi:hypothetical protein